MIERRSPEVIGLDGRPRRRERVLTQRLTGTVVLLNLENGQYYALNEVGSRVWEMCDGTRSVAKLASILSSEYAVPHESCQADVLGLLQDLASEKLVVAEG